jgi:branched-chain amino acid transport system ATP-binding protein
MVAIGRGLMGKPKQLMLDEPSQGLAPLLVSELFHVLARLNKSGLTVLLVEQNLRQSLRISDYAYVVENGVITGSGTGAELLNDEHTRKAFLGM